MTYQLGSSTLACLREAEHRHSCALADNRSATRSLERAVEKGEVISPVPRLFARALYWAKLKPDEQALHAVRALQRLHPDWVFAETSAALAYGLAVSYTQAWPLVVAYERGHYARSRGGIRRVLVERDHVWTSGNIRMTSPTRTVLDCLRRMDFVQGLALADSALKQFSLTREQLIDQLLDVGRHHRGISAAIETASYADARSDNGGESVARATMIEMGYVIPELQREVPNEVDGGTYYADFFWELPTGAQVAGELDGSDKYTDPVMTGGRSTTAVMRNERLRESRVNAAGVSVMRFSYADVMNRPHFARILDAYGIPKVGEQ